MTALARAGYVHLVASPWFGNTLFGNWALPGMVRRTRKVVMDMDDAGALRLVAEAAEETAREQRRAAAEARRLAGQRERGVSWRALASRGSLRSLVETLSAGAGRLRSAGGRFRVLAARGLAAEGVTTRRIGEEFGVSHQRVSALLAQDER